MKTCKCGNLLEDSVSFCPECGEKQTRSPSEAEYSASIGDKNVISGGVIGRKEEIHAREVTINKMEDDTKKMINCAISGKAVLRTESVTCRVCGKEVSKEYFIDQTLRCKKCEEDAFAKYAGEVEKTLASGSIDTAKRTALDQLAGTLTIDRTKQFEIEKNIREKISRAPKGKLNKIQQSEFESAIKQAINHRQLQKSFEVVQSISSDSENDKLLYWYFLLETVLTPKEAETHFEKRTIDNFWQHYWMFLAYTKNAKYSHAGKIIESNKANYPEQIHDVLLSEIAYYLYRYFETGEKSYYGEAKQCAVHFDAKASSPLTGFEKTIRYILVNERIVPEKLDGETLFYFEEVLAPSYFKEEKAKAQEKARMEQEKERQREQEKERERERERGLEREREQDRERQRQRDLERQQQHELERERLRELEQQRQREKAAAAKPSVPNVQSAARQQPEYQQKAQAPPAQKSATFSAPERLPSAGVDLKKWVTWVIALTVAFLIVKRIFSGNDRAAKQESATTVSNQAAVAETDAKADAPTAEQTANTAQSARQPAANQPANQTGRSSSQQQTNTQQAASQPVNQTANNTPAQPATTETATRTAEVRELSVSELYDEGLRQYKRFRYDDALTNFNKAAEQNHSGAQYYLGMMYLDGNGVTKNLERAFSYISRAANAGHTEAVYQLAQMYDSGIGTAKDQNQAKIWYQKAAANGNDAARRRLERL